MKFWPCFEEYNGCPNHADCWDCERCTEHCICEKPCKNCGKNPVTE